MFDFFSIFIAPLFAIGSLLHPASFLAQALPAFPIPVIENVAPKKFIANPATDILHVSLDAANVWIARIGPGASGGGGFIDSISASWDNRASLDNGFHKGLRQRMTIEGRGGSALPVRGVADKVTLTFMIPRELLAPGTHYITVLNRVPGINTISAVSSDRFPITVVSADSSEAKDAAGIPRTAGYIDGSPIIARVEPSKVFVGSSDITVKIIGGNFSTDLPKIGQFLPVELYVNDTKAPSSVSTDSQNFTATIPADFLKTPGNLKLYVVNQYRGSPQFFRSPDFYLSVIDPPTPAITNIAPSEIYGIPPRWIDNIVISGTDFSPTSVVYFDGKFIPTSFISATQLYAALPKSFLEATNAIGAYKITVFNPIGLKTSNAIDFLIKLLPPRQAPVTTGGGTSGLAPITYHRAVTPVVNDARFEGFGDSLRLRAKGLNFEESTITLNGQSLPTTRDGDDLVATIPAEIRSGLAPGSEVDVRVINGKSRVTLEGTNFTADAGIVAIGRDGIERTLSSTRVNGKIEAEIATLSPGEKYMIHVSSGGGKNRFLSPGQEIEIPQ